MRNTYFAGLGALLLVIPFVAVASERGRTISAGIVDATVYLCTGFHAILPAAADGWGGEHGHEATPGVYMPMFSTPPKGGALYNGPPLDEC
jgi:hypothetical protein